MQSLTPSKSFKIISVLVSGICYYFGFSLTGNMGWMMWIAPLPIIYVSLYVKPGHAFLIAFFAYLIGRLSWLPYLMSIMPMALAVLFTVLLPLFFALIVITARYISLISKHWVSTLSFPILFTAYEYILFNFSGNGTVTSIAYTQSNYLTLIQVVSVTGILGITFLICLFPSSIAFAWYYRKDKKTAFNILALTILLLSITFGFGLGRLKKPESGKAIRIGMIAEGENIYNAKMLLPYLNEINLANLYLQETIQLADQGAQIIVFPEKAIIISDSSGAELLNKFSQLAAAKHVQIIVAGSRQKTGYWLNNAWVFSDSGRILVDYQKVNLFIGEALDNCKPGNKIGIFSSGKVNQGVAICKDMDFQQFILGYSKKSPAILYVPAWDFVKDGWLHSRMAIMRSVEGGFSLVRNARQGRLTISDWRGKVIAEANSESGTHTVLTGKLSLEPHPTTYARAGDWFGTMSLFAAFGFLIFMGRYRK